MQKDLLSPLLKCLACGSASLQWDGQAMNCPSCSKVYRTKGDAVVFRPDFDDVEVMPQEHISNSINPNYLHWFEDPKAIILNLGAGGSAIKRANCVEAEYKVFRHTDVVADAHQLPFADNVFDYVMAMNVFEHLSNPPQASSEILRVLKPGGKVVIHTAFLQPYHEAPYHFYNATHAGVMNWFKEYKIDHCFPSENFRADSMLGFICTTMLHHVGTSAGGEAYAKLASTTLGDWANYWIDRNKTPMTEVMEIFRSIHPDVHRHFAAGFELLATKP